MTNSERRFDIDWLRVIAIALLLIYHVAIGFQSWGGMIGFITNEKPFDALWTAMSIINVWRIPLLFFISGMGVYFALQKRNWKQLFIERTQRILIPFIFGMLVIVPIHVYLWQYSYGLNPTYSTGPSHLWFLGNIFIYIVLMLPLFLLIKRAETKENNKIILALRKTLSSPFIFIIVMAFFVLEVTVLKPALYELYAMTYHGFFLGLIAFTFGFLLMWCGKGFWTTLAKWIWVLLSLAITLFSYRTWAGRGETSLLVAIESCAWILTIFALGHKYLNKPSTVLSYLSQGAYPIYIIHMIFISLGSLIIFPLDINVPMKFVLSLLFTFSGVLLTYEFIIRRAKWIRPFFGLKKKP